MTVNEIFNVDVVVVTRDDKVLEAARRMRDQHVGCVVVVGDQRGVPVGILTDRDIVVAVVALNLDAEDLKVGDVMSEPVHTIKAEQDLSAAFELMRAQGVRRLPVVDRDGHLTGIVSADDLLERLAGDCAGLARMVAREQYRELETRRVKV